MPRRLGWIGAILGRWLGWWIGSYVGFATALILSINGMGAGLYAGRRVEQTYL